MADRQIDELSFASDISDATTFAANNNAATYEAQQVSVGQIATFMGARADAVHNLGDLHYNKSNLAIDNPGAVPGWTGEYVTNANNVYPDLYTWLKTSHPELCITRYAYDAAITADGECRYFVVDEESGSIRFPKYTYTAPDYPWIYCFNAAVPQTTTQGAEYTTSLISKVSKAGDTMTGTLKMSGNTQIKFGTDDNYFFIINDTNSGNFLIYNNNGKGLFLQASDPHAPYYWDGTTGYRLLTTVDLGSSTIGENLAPDYSAAVTIPNNAVYTAPANGWIMGYAVQNDWSSYSLIVNNTTFLYGGRKSYNTGGALCFFIGQGQTVTPRADAILRFVPCIGA